MSLISRRARKRPELPLVPLIDVLVMLVLFAYVTMQARVGSTLNITLPKVETAGKNDFKGTVTVAIDKLVFHKPVYAGDAISCYAVTSRVGRTSATVHIDVEVERVETNRVEKVTEGDFVFVAIGEDRQPVPIAPVVT